MKGKYIELMEKALSAYSYEHIEQYFCNVKAKGLTEHGFPRLTVNIGILISHGRCEHLLPIFVEMMDFCCRTIPTVKAANDFSVREIVCCILEVERSGIVPKEKTEYWRECLSGIEVERCYDKFALTPTDTVKNWALFTAVSEYFRKEAGIGGSMEFIELQLLQQLQWIEENGMYMDAKGENHQPMVYDLAPRGLFSLLLNQGYRGVYYDEINEILRKAGLFSLKMQSPNGEYAFGGRSNQFIHNETWIALVFEFEAKRYKNEGNIVLAKEFRAAAKRALSVVEHWLSKTPTYHIKNRFPLETRFGCENYAYFDKYMITVASFLYGAYLICDDSIPAEDICDLKPSVWQTSRHFHKLFMKAGGYGLEFDVDADTHYDANGLGRIHKVGAPSTIAISCPCPSNPNYCVDRPEPIAFSACSAQKKDGVWCFGADQKCRYNVIEAREMKDSVYAVLECCFEDGLSLRESYTASEKGIVVQVSGDGEIGYSLPAFYFDGETYPEISIDEKSLTVIYNGWACIYKTDGVIEDSGMVAANRNGLYRAFVATAKDALSIDIEIKKV